MDRFTVVREAEIAGWGMNTWKEVKMKIRPGTTGSGIVFNKAVRADVGNAHAANGYTFLAHGRKRLLMVEHFLATCFGLGVTDIEVEVTGEELPFGDGSARIYLDLFRRAGLQRHDKNGKLLKLARPIGVKSGGRFIIALPGVGFRVHIFYELEGVLPRHFFSGLVNQKFFRREIAPARTFGKDISSKQFERYLPFKVRKVHGWLFPARKRFIDEPCRHKALDLLGDLGLLGWALEAEILAFNPGHRLNLRMVRRLMELKSKEEG
ncbi:MAG: UDP-3-O-acyl-N-acetylglucosamine deacetylase [bacterium]